MTNQNKKDVFRSRQPKTLPVDPMINLQQYGIHGCYEAPEYQEMLRKDPDQGRQCSIYLSKLHELGREKAIKLREPIIKDFLEDDLTTDEVKFMVEQIIHLDQRGEIKSQGEEYFNDMRRQSLFLLLIEQIHQFLKPFESSDPSPEEREELLLLKEKIEEMLARS